MEFFLGLLGVLSLVLIVRFALARTSAPTEIHGNIRGTGHCDLAAVGESHYQPALRAVASPGEVRHKCQAQLVLEPTNKFDGKAVRVEVSGRTVAYLSHDDAREYRKQIAKYGNLRAQCDAIIVGGGAGRSLGIWLDVPVQDEDEGDP